MKLSNGENPISLEWERRYNQLPAEIKNKLDEISRRNPIEYQLKVIKKTKNEIKEGDIFLLSPRDNIYFYGKVLMSNINHITKDTYVHGKHVVFIFKCKTKKLTTEDYHPNYSELLISPSIVDDSYWKRGYFFTIANEGINEKERELDYGFYTLKINSGFFCKANGELLPKQPRILGLFGITTITGIASMIEKELIIDQDLLNFHS